MPADRSSRAPTSWAPGFGVLRDYRPAWLRADILAGVAVAAYLVPQVMAYAVVAGLSPVVGLWASLGPIVVYAVLGSSKLLSVGPEATTALMTGAAVAALAGEGRDAASVAALLAMTTGLVCILARAARLGYLAGLLSRPVLVGYLAGVAVLMIASQLGRVSGVSIAADDPIGQVVEFATHLSSVHLPTLGLALGVLAVLLVLRRFAPTWPGPLIAMAAAVLVSMAVRLEQHGVRMVGAVPAGFPPVTLPDLTGINPVGLVTAAVGVALVGYSDSILTARAIAERDERVDTNQEFLALGAANVASGLLSGFPVSSSSSRTVLARSMGANSQVYSLVAAVVVVITMLFLSPVLARFPVPALGGVVVYAALRLIDPDAWRRVATFRRSELILALITAFAVIGFGVLVGIGLAIVLSILDLLRRLAAPHDGILGYVPGLAGMHDVADYPDTRQVPGLVVYRYDAPLFFANAENFADRALRALDEAPTPTHWFLLNAEANVEIDLTAVDALDDFRADLAQRGIVFAMARVKQDLRAQLAAAGFVDKVGERFIFPTLPTAVAGYLAWADEHGIEVEPPETDPQAV